VNSHGHSAPPGFDRKAEPGETERERAAEPPTFCDVALPVPLDCLFTYKLATPASQGRLAGDPGLPPHRAKIGRSGDPGEDAPAVVGGRVIVPFREKRLQGIVVRLHQDAPAARVKLRAVINVLDSVPVLDEGLLALGRWIASYYLAPLGEVYRTMLPLAAEFKQVAAYRITERGSEALHEAEKAGVARRFHLGDPAGNDEASQQRDQRYVYPVLDYLSEGDLVREATLRAATGASRDALRSLVAKKWIVREDLSAARDARRTVKVAVLRAPVEAMSAGDSVTPESLDAPEANAEGNPNRPTLAKEARVGHPAKLNANQHKILAHLECAGGRIAVDELRRLSVPKTTLATLVRRGLVEIVEEAAEREQPAMKPRTTLESLFTPAQQQALAAINQGVATRQFQAMLIHGVTASGKTAVYLAAMKQVLEAGRGALLLVPEIGLTPAVAADLHGVFGEQVAILHSSLSDDERAEQWHRLRRGDARIAVGTRSAVFAPVQELALIIVDEEQDHSYKQDETPRYHARDVAAVRAKALGVTVVFGSATPSLESFHNASSGKYRLLRLPDRVQQRPLPEVELIDMRQEFQATGKEHLLSRRLIEEVTARLASGEQAMILLNRRGYSAFVMCRSCGDTIQCRDCAVALTHHKRERRLMCHYCGYQQPIPKLCPKCGSDYVQFLGTGSEKLEDMLHAAFPAARIGRMDRDTVRGHQDFERILSAFDAGEFDLLVGTQMIAKGHDIHGVTLVGVVGADTALSLPDFRAAERTFQLLTQVAGRAGRGDAPGKVVLQTYFPDHYAVQFAAHHDFEGFYAKELQFRSWMHYPPFTSVANVLIRSDRQEEALRYSGVLGNWFQTVRHEGVRVMGPATAPIVRLKKDYRYHFLLKSASRERLHSLLGAMLRHADEERLPRTNIVVDVDAISLL
jgi:primosomal protein N' (replication factor Y)